MAGLDLFHRCVQLWFPPPNSPGFQPSGPLHGWNEDLTLVGLCLALLGLVDLVRPWTPVRHPGSRYFFLHTVCNAMISVACLPDLARALLSPVAALVGPTLTVFPMAAVASIHIYHVLFFRLSSEEIFHHVQFVVPLFVLGVVFKWDGGASQNWGAFFICGLPGGLNYAALVGVKEGWLSSLAQKRFDAWINATLRAPGCIVYACLQWQVWLAGSRPARGWSSAAIDFFTLLVTFLIVFNGVYYEEQSIGNYHEHMVREAVRCRVSREQYLAIFPPPAGKEGRGSSSSASAAPSSAASTAASSGSSADSNSVEGKDKGQ